MKSPGPAYPPTPTQPFLADLHDVFNDRSPPRELVGLLADALLPLWLAPAAQCGLRANTCEIRRSHGSFGPLKLCWPLGIAPEDSFRESALAEYKVGGVFLEKFSMCPLGFCPRTWSKLGSLKPLKMANVDQTYKWHSDKSW